MKVEEATLRRQYRDPDAPEVAFIADQVRELERQIREERQKAVSENGRDLNRLATQATSLRSDVEFAANFCRLPVWLLTTAAAKANVSSSLW